MNSMNKLNTRYITQTSTLMISIYIYMSVQNIANIEHLALYPNIKQYITDNNNNNNNLNKDI